MIPGLSPTRLSNTAGTVLVGLWCNLLIRPSDDLRSANTSGSISTLYHTSPIVASSSTRKAMLPAEDSSWFISFNLASGILGLVGLYVLTASGFARSQPSLHCWIVLELFLFSLFSHLSTAALVVMAVVDW